MLGVGFDSLQPTVVGTDRMRSVVIAEDEQNIGPIRSGDAAAKNNAGDERKEPTEFRGHGFLGGFRSWWGVVTADFAAVS